MKNKIIKGASSFAKSRESVSNYAYAQVSQLASDAFEKWLKQYGNARITLNTQTQNSKALAAVAPTCCLAFTIKKNRLDYIQFDTHYEDSDDMIVNVGLGQRYFLKNNTMLGYNLFYDQNMSSNVTRTGVGL
ncbi:inverse autotransporter beta domain-containing protein [Salmonella enterica]|uniref:inverse autotransporter beta domain-containing protein n=1 Tax=Salmonella enterica TaxID=28901 RepID=UPI000DED0AAB|nr:inverse autotransporter beta domain-containing protein [Salmonella enterica]AXD08624.1 hypothetical protein CHE29_06430 [Salmonella enterica]